MSIACVRFYQQTHQRYGVLMRVCVLWWKSGLFAITSRSIRPIIDGLCMYTIRVSKNQFQMAPHCVDSHTIAGLAVNIFLQIMEHEHAARTENMSKYVMDICSHNIYTLNFCGVVPFFFSM